MIPSLTSTPAMLIAIAALAYCLGTVSFGLVMARVFGLGDLREVGSGNIGATNVLRTGNKLAAFLTLVLDAAKGAAAVVAARMVAGEDAAQIAGLCAFLGHCYPAWLRFKGGKGVATFLGVLWALHWPLGIASCAVWLGTAFATRYSSLSALLAAVLSPALASILGRGDLAALTLSLAGIMLIRHEANIRRLLAGTEPKIGHKENPELEDRLSDRSQNLHDPADQ